MLLRGKKIYIIYVQFSWYAQSLLKVCEVLIQFGECLNMFWFTFCLVYNLFDVCLHIVWTKFRLAHKNTFVPARGVVVQAIDQGAVAVHQHRPTLIVLHVCLYPDPAQEIHAPEPSVVQGGFEFGKGPALGSD